MAQVTFTLDSTPSKAAKPSTASSWNPFKKSNEPAAPDAGRPARSPRFTRRGCSILPAAESDQIFKLLSSQNFFNTERPGAEGVAVDGQDQRHRGAERLGPGARAERPGPARPPRRDNWWPTRVPAAQAGLARPTRFRAPRPTATWWPSGEQRRSGQPPPAAAIRQCVFAGTAPAGGPINVPPSSVPTMRFAEADAAR